LKKSRARVEGEDLTITGLGLSKPHLVFVEDPQVDQGGQGDGGASRTTLVEFDGGLVVAVEVVDVGQLEQGAGVLAFEAEGLLELDGGRRQLAVVGELAPELIVVLGRAPRQVAEPVEDVPGLVDLAGPPQGPGAMQLGGLRIVARLGGRGERLRRVAPALEILEGHPAMEMGEAQVARLGQLIQSRLEATEQDIAHPEPEVNVGRHRPLPAIAHRGHGIPERSIARWIAPQHLAKVGHGPDVERITIQERAYISGH